MGILSVWPRRQLWYAALLLRGQTLQKLAWLRRVQWLPPGKVLELQRKRLQALLEHSATHVPYYADLLRGAGVISRHGDIDLTRFTSLPPLAKEDLSTHATALLSDDAAARRAYPNSTGGSTGVPTQFYNDAESFEWQMAGKALYDEWGGYTTGMPRVGLWGSMRDIEATHVSLARRLGYKLRNESWLNAFLMDAPRMRTYVEHIRRRRPYQILAHADAAHDLARLVLQERLQVPAPRAVMTSAGTLTEEMRGAIEAAFRAPVFNRYGCREVGDIACDCERRHGLHVLSTTYLVEVVDDVGAPVRPGESGEILVTDLTNYSHPFIRYRIGDRATAATEPCPCGRGLPTLAAIQGRMADFLVRRDGSRLSYIYPSYLVGILLNLGWVARFQVIQESYEEVRLLLEPIAGSDQSPARRAEDAVTAALGIEHALGEGFRVTPEIVERIAPSASGKHRDVICKVTEGGA